MAVLAMIRNLPRDSRYTTLVSWQMDKLGNPEPEGEKPQEVKDLEERVEMRSWAHRELELGALTVNRVQDLISTLYSVVGSKPPEWPLVGPEKWREHAKNSANGKRERVKPEDATVEGAMRAMGLF